MIKTYDQNRKVGYVHFALPSTLTCYSPLVSLHLYYTVNIRDVRLVVGGGGLLMLCGVHVAFMCFA